MLCPSPATRLCDFSLGKVPDRPVFRQQNPWLIIRRVHTLATDNENVCGSSLVVVFLELNS